jgi:hypothetical protein
LHQQIAAQPIIDASPVPNSDVDVFAPNPLAEVPACVPQIDIAR